MNGRILRRSLAVTGVLALALAGCGGSSDDNGGSSSSSKSSGSGGGKSGTVALLLPETKTARYESADRPYFTQKLKALCPDCTLLYSNADQKADTQQQQAEAALTKGADVLVLDPVDGKAAANIVAKAKQQNVPVVSYDRLSSGPVDYYISFDNQRVGKLQGQALLKALGSNASSDQIVMINGSPTDPNAADFKKGAHSVLDGKVKISKEYDTPDWSPDKAQQEMEQAITAVGKSNIDGVYAANDGTGGGAIAAMKSAGFNPVPPTTGQDAELAAIQRILKGDQYMTVYKAIKPEAEKAAQIAYDLVQGNTPTGITKKLDNGTAQIPSVLLTPVSVTKANVNDTVIKDGFYTADQVCTGQYAKYCKQAGIS